MYKRKDYKFLTIYTANLFVVNQTNLAVIGKYIRFLNLFVAESITSIMMNSSEK